MKAIHHPSTRTEALPEGNSTVQDRTAATIWSWLAARRDISVGTNREYNHLSLDEVLALSAFGSAPGQDAETLGLRPENSTATRDVRVYASEDTMWESLTGHAVDYKRVPKSEWMLLLGIASTTTQGILQGDLGRLMDQDKRSVPKRTDSLLKKGYIVKRTTLVRGTKTSKMWLKLFAPPLPKDGEGADEARPDMTLTRQVLVEDLEPVPWRIRWTGESIDYIALATTIMAIVKEWGVLQMKDMKSKLGVLGMRWQMKVLAKVCRFLNQRGVIQYVAAKLGEKVFKDCVKYVRDLNSEDWSLYLSTGKRKSKTPRNPDLDGLDGNKQLIGQASSVSEISKAPPWSLDKPVPVIIAEMAKRLGDTGLTNPDVYALTLGPSYSRHLSSMTTALSVPDLQPPHLAHFQIYSEHTRTGKVASYRYFAPNALPDPPPPTTDNTGQSSIANSYGFPPIQSGAVSSEAPLSLAELCNMGMANRTTKGRPKKPKAKKEKATPTPKKKPGRKRRDEPSETLTQPEVAEEPVEPQEVAAPQEDITTEEAATSQEAALTQVQDSTSKLPEMPPRETRNHVEATQTEIEGAGQNDAAPVSSKADKLVVTLKVPPDALKELLETLQTSFTTPRQPIRTRPSRSSARKIETRAPEPTAENEESQTQGDISDEPEEGSNKQLLNGRKRGRPKKGEVRRKRNEEQPDGSGTPSKSWVCEKCGRGWKNDNGLLYHLTKSRTTCNPSFDESTLTPVRRGRKGAASEIEEEQASATPTASKPQEEDQEIEMEEDAEISNKGDNDRGRGLDRDPEKKQDKEPSPVREDGPTPKRVSTLRGPVAARPTWSSRPTVSFKVHVNPELHRPPVTMFDSPKKPSLLNGTNGALVQGEDSQLRPILGSLDRFSLPGGSPKTPCPKPERNGPRPATTPLPEQITPSRPLINGTSSKPSSITKPKTPSAIGTPVSKAVMNNRIFQIVQGILEEQQGVFPGGKSLWTAITLRWAESYSEVAPQIRTYQAAFRELLKNKSMAEHWLTFRSKKGITEKCHIIVQPGIDPFSPEAEEVVRKIQDAHPDPYLPPPFDAQVDSDLLKRGRRDLPEEVEMLDAPVYVARAAQKRAQDEYDSDGDDFPPPAKRGRKRKSTFAEGRASKSRAYQNEMGEAMRYEHFEPSHGAPEALQFLDPNTFLDEDDVEGSENYFNNGLGGASQNGLSAHFSGEIVFDKPIIVSGYDGIWPYISPQDFEMQDASYTLKGWMPDRNWFAWSSMIEMIDRKAHSLNRQKLQRDGGLDPYQSFIARTYICTDLERAWSDSFIHAPPGAAGPYNIFVSFSSEARSETIKTPTISWPSEWQLTQKSFPENVPDHALPLDSPSEVDEEEDEDSPEWPSFPMSLHKSQYRISRATRRGRGGRTRGSGGRPRASARQIPQQPRVKRVRLITRALMPLPEDIEQSQSQVEPTPLTHGEEAERLLAALVAVRVLLGGADKSIDWGLLLKLFPDLSLKDMRRFWVDARRDQGAYIRKLTKDFQDRFIVAYSKNELPEFDFEEPMDYDWDSLIDWTLELPRRRGIDLPSTRGALENDFTFQKVTPHEEEDPREKFYNPQTSVFARFEAIATPAFVTVDQMLNGPTDDHVEITERVIARSWVRSLCCTDESRYTVDQIKQKFSTLAGGDQEKINLLLKEAIDTLTQQRIICKSKRPPLSGRPFRLNEAFGHVLGKLAQRTKYKDAADFKTQLDAIFRRGEAYRIPFTLNDGSVMALMNLNASERIRLVPVNVPHIPLGFKPGQYEMRKLKKSLYSHDLEAVPTDSYKYDEDIDVLRESIYEGPPTAGKGKNSVLPQWVDFFGRREAERWMDVLGAFCFVYANRGLLTIEGVCNALKPVLEEFEAKLITDWGVKTGVLKYSEEGLGLTVGEWWWLAVPWQWGRQFRQRGYDPSMD